MLICELQNTTDLSARCLWERSYFWSQHCTLGLLSTLLGTTSDHYPADSAPSKGEGVLQERESAQGMLI